MTDELLKAIRDNPDDDAPRLVWADRVGGERGELVVLQCAIAAKRGTREDRVKMQARVRAIGGAGHRRGFVEHASVGMRDVGPALLERYPMLRELEVMGFAACVQREDMPRIFHEVVVPRLGEALATLPIGLHALGLHVGTSYYDERGESEFAEQGALIEIVRASHHAATLRALRVDLGTLDEVPAAMPTLDELAVNAGKLSEAQIISLLQAHPRLTSLAVRFIDFDLAPLLAAPEVQRLRALDLFGAQRFDPALAFGPHEHLGLGHIDLSPNLGVAFATMPTLRSLDATQHRRRPPVRLPANDAIERLQLTRIDDETVAHLLAMPNLEELTLSAEPRIVQALRAVIPRVNDG